MGYSLLPHPFPRFSRPGCGVPKSAVRVVYNVCSTCIDAFDGGCSMLDPEICVGSSIDKYI